jgi:hypothetical protein
VRYLMACGLFLAAIVACSSDDTKETPSGTGGTPGAGGSGGGCGKTPLGFPGECHAKAPPECCSATLPVMKVRREGALADPDWSCITGGGGGAGGAAGASGGAGAAGAAGAAEMRNVFEVEDFVSEKGVPDIGVELFEGESLVGRTPFYTDVTKGVENHANDSTLNPGQFWFPHPASPIISYRVKEKPGIAKEFVGYGYDVPPPPRKVTGATLSPASYEQLSAFAVPIAGWDPPPDLAIVVGPIRDCAQNDVGGARIKFFDEQSNQEIEPGTCDRDVRYIYFDDQYPNPRCAYTDYRQSLWVIANSPSNGAGAGLGKKYRVEYWGRLSESQTEPVKFAEKSLEIVQNTVNVHQIMPNVQQK